MTLSITTLGQIQIKHNNRPVTGLVPRKKTEALLIYLASTPGQHSRLHLATLLWGDYPEDRALNNLSVTLSSLRKQLAPFLTITHDTLGINPTAALWLDSQELDNQTAPLPAPIPANLPRMAAAVALYQGEFLAGFHLPRAPEFEDWMRFQQEKWQQRLLLLLEHLALAYQKNGQFTASETHLHHLLTIDPLHESAHRQLMSLFALKGERNAALLHYEKCRQILWGTLGIEPEAETIQLFEQIKENKRLPRPGSPNPPSNLPAPLTPLFDRQQERQRLSQIITSPTNRLVTLVGEGGIGKTRLALATASHIQNQFSDGVWFVPLAGLESQPSATSTLQDAIAIAIAQALSLTLSGQQSPPEQIINWLKPRRLLLLLDNFEHILAGADLVHTLLQQAQHLAILCTSRQPLNFLAEVIYPVQGLSLPPQTPLPANAPPPHSYAAIQLFADRASRVNINFSLTAETTPHVSRLCQLVNGNPLGIELAASATRHRSLLEIERAIWTSFDTLSRQRRDLPPRQRSMRATFNYSWKLLTPAEQWLFAQLAVFRGGFTASAAQALTGATLDDLDLLCDKSLLQLHDGRFVMHELLRHFAQEQLQQLQPVPAGAIPHETQHSHYYLTLLAQQEAPLQGPTPQTTAATLEPDLDNIRKAWRTAVAQANSRALSQSVRALSHYYLLRGQYQEGQQAFQVAADSLVTQPQNAPALARLLTQQAHMLIRLARYEKAIELLQTALPYAQQSDDDETQSTAHLLWGVALWRQGQYETAADQVNRALTLAQNLNSPNLIAACQQNLGVIRDYQGFYEAAQDHLNIALPLWQQTNNQKQIALTLNSLGLMAYHQGALAQAKTALNHALQINERLGNWQGQMLNLNNLSLIATEQKAYQEAHTHLTHGLQLAHKSGDLAGEALLLLNLGRTAYEQESFATAQRYLEQALPLSRRISDLSSESIALRLLGDVAQASQQYDQARAYYKAGLAICQQIGEPYQTCHVWLGLAELEEAAHAPHLALPYAQEGYQLAQQLQNDELQNRGRAILTKITNQHPTPM